MHPLQQLSALEAFLYQAVAVVWAGSEIGIGARTVWKRSTYGAPRSLREDRWSGVAVVGGVLLSVWAGVAVAATVPKAGIQSGASAWFFAGMAVALAGIALRLYAVATLGRWFELRVTTSAGQPVIQSGPYRLIRHPSYAGGLLTVLGMQLMMVNWLALACFVIAWPGFAYRIRVEEAALTRNLGEPYRAYMNRTKRLIPFVL